MEDLDEKAQWEDELAAHRREIDALDQRLLALLNERAGHALAIRDLKGKLNLGLYDPNREAQIVEVLQACNEGPLYGDHIDQIYTAILKVMKEIPSND